MTARIPPDLWQQLLAYFETHEHGQVTIHQHHWCITKLTMVESCETTYERLPSKPSGRAVRNGHLDKTHEVS